MINVIKQEIGIEESLRRRLEIICDFCTAPVKKIVAEVLVEDLISSSPSQLWNITKQHAGISKSKYMEYFANNDTAFAYKLGKVTKYEKAMTLKEIGINYYPQSYVYLNN